MRVPAATVLAVIGAAVFCAMLAACGEADSSAVALAKVSANLCKGDIGNELMAAGVSSDRWWGAEVALGQVAATWILATICRRAMFTTAPSQRRRRRCGLSGAAQPSQLVDTTPSQGRAAAPETLAMAHPDRLGPPLS